MSPGGTWILLRGLMRETRHWGKFPGELVASLPGATIITLDLPGNGQAHTLPSPLRVEDMAQYCRHQLLARGLAPPYHVLALSLGAMVAVAWSVRHPEELAAAVLINTSLRPFHPFYRRLRPHNYFDIVKLACSRTSAQQERLIWRLTSNQPVHPAILQDWAGWRRQCPVSRRNALRQLGAALRYRAPPTWPAVPLLILASSHDRLVDARCSQQLARHWQAPLALHPSAGHDLPLDDGPWVAEQVRAWNAALP